MRTSQATVKLSVDRTTVEGIVSVKLRVSYQRDRRRYSFPIKEPVLTSRENFERLSSYHSVQKKNAAKDIRVLYNKLLSHIERAEQICKTLQPFSFEGFKQQFYSAVESFSTDLFTVQRTDTETNVIALLDNKAAKLMTEDRIGNAQNYAASVRSLERFLAELGPGEYKQLLDDSPALLLSHVTPMLLGKYERWMLQRGKTPRSATSEPGPASLTTISIYTRNLRAIYNEAIDAKLISVEAYPFGKKGYVIPASVNTKKALSKSDVLLIIKYQADAGSVTQWAKDMWVFSYLSNGMNLTDMFHLRWKDLDLKAKTLTFIRQKTTQTRKGKQVKILASLFPESLAILDRWSSAKKGASDYVFPQLDDSMDALRRKMVIKHLTKQTNKYMARIAGDLGIESEVSSHVARHSFATILLRSEVPVAFISKSLGHTSLKTTEDYLGSFEDEQRNKYLSNLI